MQNKVKNIIEFKKKIAIKLLENLEFEMNVMVQAAIVAREAATHEESKAEDKYDTRGLEASYLAGAQAKRAAELQKLIHTYQGLDSSTFKLVEVETKNKNTLFAIVPKGGGSLLEIDNIKVQVVTPDSRLGAELIHRQKGDFFEVKLPAGPCEYEILNIY